MNDIDWETVWGTFCDLWPRVGPGMTDEEQMSYRRAMGHANWQQAQVVLRTIKDTGKHVPLPREIRDMMRAQGEAAAADKAADRRAAEDRHREELDRRWWETKQHVEALGVEIRERHKAAAIASDWRLDWAKDKPVTDRAWVALVYQRVCRGLGPDDPDPEADPPPRLGEDERAKAREMNDWAGGPLP